MAGRRRARTPGNATSGIEAEPSATRKPRGSAKDRALRLLAVRWRSREELRRRLTLAGFEADDVERAVSDLEDVGLVDDARFAAEVVRHQTGSRLVGDRVVRATLRQRGVAAEEVEVAMAGLGDERERAMALADARVGRMSSLTPDAAARRLYALLVRRGYGSSVASEAARRAVESRDGFAGSGHAAGGSQVLDEGVIRDP